MNHHASHADAARFVRGLDEALLDLELLPPGDPEAEARRDATVAVLSRYIEARGVLELELHFAAGLVKVDGEPLIEQSLRGSRLLGRLRARNVRSLRFERGTTARELRTLAELLLDERQVDAFSPANLGAAFLRLGLTHVSARCERRPGVESPRPDAVRGYQQLAAVVQDNHIAAARGDELELADTSGAVEGAMRWMATRPSDLLALASYEDVDRFTVGHSVRVALLAMLVARSVGVDDEMLRLVGSAALLHDIGKSKVPSSILFKRGRLDDDEWRAMSEHTRHGAEILLAQKGVHPSAVGVAFSHHLSPAGAGYPNAVLPFMPSSMSRLVRVCDVFEALTAMRPYKPELTPAEALAIMHRNRADFDQRWLHAFVAAIGAYPVGSFVELTDGRFAMVVAHGPRANRPVVRVVGGELSDAVVGVPGELEDVGVLRGLRRSESVVAGPRLLVG
ncbi:MAG: HD domain-containing protein [Planctomycetes bacterium]|nr:HD domain-containing protein [Planctomycetota bacterium]